MTELLCNRSAVYVVTTYKWTCLILGLGLWYVWTLVSPAYYKWKSQKEEEEWEAKLHKGNLNDKYDFNSYNEISNSLT